MVRLFPKYSFDDRLRIRPSSETPTVRFTNLKEILLSTDLTRNAEIDWVGPKKYRFLDGTDLALTGQQVCFQSLPRTGNSFLRSILEQVTGVYTGSDMNFDLTLHIINSGAAGEETVSHENLCWITKTHWPMESPMGNIKFSA